MGLNLQGGNELAPLVLTASLSSTTFSSSAMVLGMVNFTISGTFSATVQIERSFDGGANFVVCAQDTSGTAASYTGVVSCVLNEPEPGVYYRFRCTAYTSGTAVCRMSGGQRLT